MAGITEIRQRIGSVQQTMKITNAMHLIASSKMQKARAQLTQVEPYFDKCMSTVVDILHHMPDIDHPYFDTRRNASPRKTGFLVITADKGLSGSYNHNVMKLAESRVSQAGQPSLFVVGQVGRSAFAQKGMPIDTEFLYAAQDPTLYRAREISETMANLFLRGQLDEVYVVFTRMVSALKLEPEAFKLLPLEKEEVLSRHPHRERYYEIATFEPSPDAVLDLLVPAYLRGVIFGTLVESFCSEQSARMTAMDTATKSAKEMIQGLTLQYNRARQAAITQEISEIVGGAQAQNQL